MKAQATVIITTRDRPEMLGEALQSVRLQTWAAAIKQVIVSENGATEASRNICEQFGDLPLCYLRQNPPVSSLLHLTALWHHVDTPLVAILHDDDWWDPRHLENALGTLEKHPECVATYSNFLDTYGPTVVPFLSEKAWRVWVSSGCDFSPPLLMLDKVGVLLACLLNSTFHYSTLVGRKEAIWATYLKMVAEDNAWDNERTFPVFLSAQGPIGYLTSHAAFIRNHPAQEGFDAAFRAKGFGEMRVKTTRWLARLDPNDTKLAVARFNHSVKTLRPELVSIVSGQIEEPQRSVLIKELRLNLVPSPESSKKWLLKQLCPPVVLALRRKVKGTGRKLAAKK